MIDFKIFAEAIAKNIGQEIAMELEEKISFSYKQRMSQFIYGGRRYYFTDRHLFALPALHWKRCSDHNHIYGIGIHFVPVIKIGKVRHQNPYWMSKKEVDWYERNTSNSREGSEIEKSGPASNNLS